MGWLAMHRSLRQTHAIGMEGYGQCRLHRKEAPQSNGSGGRWCSRNFAGDGGGVLAVSAKNLHGPIQPSDTPKSPGFPGWQSPQRAASATGTTAACGPHPSLPSADCPSNSATKSRFSSRTSRLASGVEDRHRRHVFHRTQQVSCSSRNSRAARQLEGG
jgi:hypothetical protein